MTVPFEADPDGLAATSRTKTPRGTLGSELADTGDEIVTTLYVDPQGGDDRNDGQSETQAWRSLQLALDRLTPGQTLYLMDGTYSGPLVEDPAHFVVRVDGEPDAWITVAAAPSHTPVLHPTEGNGLVVKDADYVEISGLTVEGQGFGPENAYGWGLLVRNSHHVKLSNNTISNMAVGGISAVESANLTITGNTTFNNSYWGTEQGSGISVWHSVDHGFEPDADGYSDRVVGNISYGNENKVYSRWHPGQNVMSDGNGIIIDETRDFDYPGRFLVANNIVFNNGGRGIAVTRSRHVDVLFNTTYHNGHTKTLNSPPSELATTYSSDVRLMNNLAIAAPGQNDWRVFESSGIESGGNIWVTSNPTGWATEADLVTDADPGLTRLGVTPNSADFRPRPDSIVVGAAMKIADFRVEYDFDGTLRPEIGADVGAFETSE